MYQIAEGEGMSHRVVNFVANGFRNSLTERQLLTPSSYVEFKPSDEQLPSNSTRNIVRQEPMWPSYSHLPENPTENKLNILG